jgi:hypothetical protein
VERFQFSWEKFLLKMLILCGRLIIGHILYAQIRAWSPLVLLRLRLYFHVVQFFHHGSVKFLLQAESPSLLKLRPN